MDVGQAPDLVRAMTKRPGDRKRVEAKVALVRELRDRTVCARCGAQPIEWHGAHHRYNKDRPPALARLDRSVEAILADIERCEPLCRRCHMEADGRLVRNLMPGRSVRPTKACVECAQPYKPLRRGLCKRCDDRRRRPRKPGPFARNLPDYHSNSRLTSGIVAEMRALHAAGGWTFGGLAQRYGCSASTAGNVVRNRVWKESASARA